MYELTEELKQQIQSALASAIHPGVTWMAVNDLLGQINNLPEVEEKEEE